MHLATSFSDQKGFALAWCNLDSIICMEKKSDLQLMWCLVPEAQAAVFGTASGQAIINQAFVYYKFGDKRDFEPGPIQHVRWLRSDLAGNQFPLFNFLSVLVGSDSITRAFVQTLTSEMVS